MRFVALYIFLGLLLPATFQAKALENTAVKLSADRTRSVLVKEACLKHAAHDGIHVKKLNTAFKNKKIKKRGREASELVLSECSYFSSVKFHLASCPQIPDTRISYSFLIPPRRGPPLQ